MPSLSDDLVLIDARPAPDREANERYEYERREAEDTVRATVRDLYLRYSAYSYPVGGVLALIRWEVETLTLELEPPPRRKNSTTKQRIPAALRWAVYERDAHRCVDCGGWHELTVDHRIPESRGGPTTLENLQTMCRPCNSRKGARIA